MNTFAVRDTTFVKERIIWGAANAYDLIDPATGQSVGTVQEHVRNIVMKILKLTTWAQYCPFAADMIDESGEKVLTLKKPFTLWGSTITVVDEVGGKIGHLRMQMRLAISARFDVYDSQGQQVATIRGDWASWNFNAVDNQGIQMATVTKKWAGLGKELFTSADNYVVDISPSLKDQGLRKLILAAAIGIDMVLKNRG